VKRRHLLTEKPQSKAHYVDTGKQVIAIHKALQRLKLIILHELQKTLEKKTRNADQARDVGRERVPGAASLCNKGSEVIFCSATLQD
jgi:hypothetical protein